MVMPHPTFKVMEGEPAAWVPHGPPRISAVHSHVPHSRRSHPTSQIPVRQEFHQATDAFLKNWRQGAQHRAGPTQKYKRRIQIGYRHRSVLMNQIEIEWVKSFIYLLDFQCHIIIGKAGFTRKGAEIKEVKSVCDSGNECWIYHVGNPFP